MGPLYDLLWPHLWQSSTWYTYSDNTWYCNCCTRAYSRCSLKGPVRYFSKIFHKKLKNVSCEYDQLNGWNSTMQAAWHVRHVRWTCLFYTPSISFLIICITCITCFLGTKPTWLLMLSFTKIVRACSIFYPYEGYRSVTPLDAAKVNKTIFHNHSVHWYYIALIKGRDYSKHDNIIVRHGKQNPHRGRWL